MKSQIRNVDDHGNHYTALMFVCPGCQSMGYESGIHMLPVNSPSKSPSWNFNGNLEAPTLSPSILTKTHGGVCHSFLENGVFRFLSDCTHSFKDQLVPIPDLPWGFIKIIFEPTELNFT